MTKFSQKISKINPKYSKLVQKNVQIYPKFAGVTLKILLLVKKAGFTSKILLLVSKPDVQLRQELEALSLFTIYHQILAHDIK